MRLPPRKPSPPPPLQALRRAGAGAVSPLARTRWFAYFYAVVGTGVLLALLAHTSKLERFARADLTRCRADHETVTAAILRTRAEDQAFWESRVRNADYVLWEVHEIAARTHDDTLRDLCSDVSVHSVTWPNTELMGYGSFVDGHNRRQLTCRWLHSRTP
jgi:hypothetical protein